MSNNKFFIRQYSFENFFHGGIGYADAEKILIQKGYKAIEFPYHNRFTAKAKFSRFFYLIKAFFSVPENSTIVFLFPVFAQMIKLLLKILSFRKNLKIICFVADIDGIKDADEKLLHREIKELSRFQYFIVHNNAMQEWLQSHLPGRKIASIDFFDFLAPAFEGTREKNEQIVFAGNLGKSEFLEKLSLLEEKSPALRFNLYGPGCTDYTKAQKNVNYKGIISPYQLPVQLEGSFGLVWDGDSIDIPAGPLGEYMRFITHHKISLYILSGLPVIVPKMAASAELVNKYNIGITINSLHEMEGEIDKLSDEAYRCMRENMKSLAQKISTGQCLSDAINKLINNN